MENAYQLESTLLKILKKNLYTKNINTTGYYNKYLSNGSVILSLLLQKHLEQETYWDLNKWIDDILIRNVKQFNDNIVILGNVIYGNTNTTEEYISPLYFTMELFDKWENFKEYTLLFDTNKENELNYIKYKNNREKWDSYYDKNYSSENDDWKYKIKVIKKDKNNFIY